jgi:hypothetical protein
MKGNIRKMVTALESPAQYTLPIGDDLFLMNDVIGKKIQLEYLGEINCVSCGRKTKKSFGQGHCYPCFRDLAECDMCIMKPETCHYDAGTCREPEWGEAHCMQSHFVYLANSSGIKVGITRGTQIPTRWIDQGASEALPIFNVDTRLQSGLIEVVLKEHVSDRTDWRKMLKGTPDSVDLKSVRDELIGKCEPAIEEIKNRFGEHAIRFLSDEQQVDIKYPVESYPEKVKSLNFDKQEKIEGILQGIKGQYLILDIGVLNIRKFSGYNIALQVQ